jgi:hypothetical protein
VSFRITDKDRGAAAKIREFMAARSRVKVGIFADAGSYEDGKSVLEIAAIHEFGIGQERRSFVADWADQKQGEIRAKEKALAVGYARGRLSLNDALEQLGQWGVGSIQERISAGIPPPNAPATVAKKGSSTPLIDSNTLRSSVTYRVEAGTK